MAVTESGLSLKAIPLDLGDLDRVGADNQDVLIDSGSTATVVLDGQGPLWMGLLAGEALVREVAEIAPDLEPRIAPGLNRLAACGSILAMVVTDPYAIVGVDVATGSVAWEVSLTDSVQIACGDPDVVLVQEDETIRGIAVDDGSRRWSQPIRPDDPLRLSPDRGLIGSYDGVVGLDLGTGDRVWALGGDHPLDTVVVPSPVGTLVQVDDRYIIVDPAGQVIVDFDPDAFDVDYWNAFVAGTGNELAVIDPRSGSAISANGSRSLLSADVVEVIGVGPDGLIWAVVHTEQGTAWGLVDVDGQIVAAAEAGSPGPNRVALPGVLFLLDSAQAIVVS